MTCPESERPQQRQLRRPFGDRGHHGVGEADHRRDEGHGEQAEGQRQRPTARRADPVGVAGQRAHLQRRIVPDGLLEKVVGKEMQERIGLSITAALEHYTASIAETVLKHPDISEGMPEDMRQMFMWHAAEEIEHKSVAFDVFTDVAGGSYGERMIGFAFGSAYLLYYIGLGWGHYLLADKQLNKVSLPQAI